MSKLIRCDTGRTLRFPVFKTLVVCMLAVACLMTVVACGPKPVDYTRSEVPYFDGLGGDGSYDSSLFYRNDLFTSNAADPSVIWVPEDRDPEYGGWFYMYLSGDYIGLMRSKDLTTWSSLGTALRFDYSGYWLGTENWAPEVLYNETDRLYYLYFNANKKPNSGGRSHYITVATSESPAGPFTLWRGTNLNGETISADTPAMNFRGVGPVGDIGTIDANPFLDDDGRLYLYFSDQSGKNCMYGVQMKDWVTPDYSTLTLVARPGYATPDGEESAVEKDLGFTNCNEGPHMIKHDGKYFLTYSGGNTFYASYSVLYAIGDEPLGEFVKPEEEDGNPLLGVDGLRDDLGGTGHHCFVTVGDEVFAVYHELRDLGEGNANYRSLAIDRLMWLDNAKYGCKVPYINGPTRALQPRPAAMSGYGNIAAEAEISVKKGTATGTEYLSDGIFTTRESNSFRETSIDGSATIEFKFPEPKKIKAIMVYNAYSFDCAFAKIDNITISATSAPEKFFGKFKGTVSIENIGFDTAWCNLEEEFMRPGGSALVEFPEIEADSFTLTVSTPLAEGRGSEIRISDVVVLGRV